MRRWVLVLALLATPAQGAPSPCEIVAAGINATQARGVPASALGKTLAFENEAFPDLAIAPAVPANIRLGRLAFTGENGATRSSVPHVSGVHFVEFRQGTARCQLFSLYRRVDGAVRILAKPPIDGEGALCGVNVVRPLGIGGRGYIADVDGYSPGIALYAVTRAGMAREPICRVAIETRIEGGIEMLEPTDAASMQARQAAMAELVRALPELARAFRTGLRDPILPDMRELESRFDAWSFAFSAGSGRYIARLTDHERRLRVSLARVWPELGNRERALGGFVFAGESRFVRALAEPATAR